MMTMDRALLSTNASTSFSGRKNCDSRIVETRRDDDEEEEEYEG